MLVKRVAVRIRQAPQETPSVSMEKDQLISMIHFLEKREELSKKETQILKVPIKELRETNNQKLKTQSSLLALIDRLTKQVADLTKDNIALQKG